MIHYNHSLDQALAERDIKDAVVRVILTVAPEHSDLIDERQIRERLREAYLLAGIIKRKSRRRHVRATRAYGNAGSPAGGGTLHLQSSRIHRAASRLLEQAQLLLQELQEGFWHDPLSLRLHNFMSEDTPPLDFSRFTTACLTGDNGHGKSTLLDAITWALWGETRAKSLDDVVRLGRTKPRWNLSLTWRNERYRVLRKRSLKTRQSALELQGFDQAAQRYRPLNGANIRS